MTSHINSIERILKHLVAKSAKGSKFSLKVSPGQSRINLTEEIQQEPLPVNKFEFSHLEYDLKEFTNVSIIEQSLINEENEEFFELNQGKITPALVNLDEIVEEVLERRSKTPAQMVENERKDSPVTGRLTKNGRWYRKSNQQFKKIVNKPKFSPRPPAGPAKFVRKVRKSKSLKAVGGKNFFEFEDYKKLGLKDIYECIEQYAVKNYRPARDDWMD